MLWGMGQIAYLNGRYLPRDQAMIRADDRGFIFADGVYEVVRYYAGRPLSMVEHLDRLAQSLSALRIDMPSDAQPFDRISAELMHRNGLVDAYVYWQVTRGVAERDHRFPDPPVRPTTYAFARPMPPLALDAQPRPMRAMTHPEIRWANCAIKSVSLLPNVLARQAAADRGLDEAVFVRPDGLVTEGTARSLFIVENGALHTYPLDGRILGSITRKTVIELAAGLGVDVHEAPFDCPRLYAASEVIAVGTTTEVRPVVAIDDRTIADGSIGPVTGKRAHAVKRHVMTACAIAG
jgi:D-alanine transaminase